MTHPKTTTPHVATKACAVCGEPFRVYHSDSVRISCCGNACTRIYRRRKNWAELPNPSGLCMCGCGQTTPIAKKTDASRNTLTGEHLRFVRGHHRHLSPVDYAVEDRGYATPCWVWQRGKDSNGYGHLVVDGATVKAHRHFFEQANGPLPPDLEPDHLCRVRACINPDHMEAVTHAENSRRAITTKLTAEKVQEIRGLFGAMTQRAIAAQFGVDESTICDIKKERTWQ